MKSLKHHLQAELKNNDFRIGFEKELRLARLAVQIAKHREKKGLTQAGLAIRAHITQQQVSKVEHAGASGFNVNTLFRVCDALGLEFTLSPRKDLERPANLDRPAKRKHSVTATKKIASSTVKKTIKAVPAKRKISKKVFHPIEERR
jgi:transcriptional regulator with XRE-family HTH domain